MSIFYVLLLFLITSGWINQQIDETPQGFDISSSILCDHTEKGTSILMQCSKLTLTQLDGCRFHRWKLTF